MSLSSSSLPPPTFTEPSSPPPYVNVPGPIELWLTAHVEWLQDPTTSFNFYHRLYCAVVFILLALATTPFLWILPSCFLPNWAKALWVAFLSWEGRKQWRFWKKRGAELRRRKEESERLESEKLESGLGEGIVDEKVGLEGEKMETAVEVVPAGSDEREREGREELSSR